MARQPRSGTNLLLGTLLAGVFFANIDLAVVNIAAPSIHQTLGASGAELQCVVSGYAVSYAMLLVVGARLGSLFGFGRAFLAGVVLFTFASAACGLAPDTTSLIVARVVQGAGGALMVAQVLSGIQLTFSGEGRTRAIGAYAIALSAGAVAGQVIGGVVVAADVLGLAWRPAFLVNIPIGVLLALLTWRLLPRASATGAATRSDVRGASSPAALRTRTARIDGRGVVTLASAVLLLIVPLIFGREAGWPFWTWASLALCLLAFWLFVVVERSATASGHQPLVRLEVFTCTRVTCGLIAAAASLSTYHSMLFVLALYLQQGFGRSPLFSGLALVSWVSAFGIAGPVLARARRLHVVALSGYLMMTAAYIGLAVCGVLGFAGNDVLLFALLGLGGLGFGLGRNASIADMTASAGSDVAADLSGLINTASQVAGAVGVAVFGTLYLSMAPFGGAAQSVPAFSSVCFALALTTLGATIAAGCAAEPRSLRGWQHPMHPSASAPSSPSS